MSNFFKSILTGVAIGGVFAAIGYALYFVVHLLANWINVTTDSVILVALGLALAWCLGELARGIYRENKRRKE